MGPACQPCPLRSHALNPRQGLRAHVARRTRNHPTLGHLKLLEPHSLSLPHSHIRENPQPSVVRTPERSRHRSPPTRARSAAFHRRPKLVPPPLLRPRHALCHGKFRLDIHSSERTPIRYLPLWYPLHALTRPPPCSGGAVAGPLLPSRGPWGSSWGKKPPCPLLFPSLLSVARNSSPKLSGTAAAEPPQRGPPPSGAPTPMLSSPSRSLHFPWPPWAIPITLGHLGRPRPSSSMSPHHRHGRHCPGRPWKAD
jgi:hypothetical protein